MNLRITRIVWCAPVIAGLSLFLSQNLLAQPEPPTRLPETVVEGVQPTAPPAFNPTAGAGSVFGDPSNVFNVPGSGTFLDLDDIRNQSYANVDRVLRRAPGVYLRAEDGYGNFPNISLRGVDTTRSAKVTIMEDGVLTAPAPYAAPSAYYFPNVARMSAVEVIKGHSQIMFGPHTTGGAINFLSTQIPEDTSLFLRTEFGSYNEYRMHFWAGGTGNGANGGRWGFLAEGYLREADGFRTIDEAPDFRSPDNLDTGFSRREPMVKLFFEPNTSYYQRIEAKYGYTDFDANETYLGLTEADVRNTPLRRYSASRFDNIDTHQSRSFLRWTIGDSETDWLSITHTVYYNEFDRNWFKLHDIRDIDTDGDGTPNAGANSSLSAALAGGTGGQALEVLQGQRAGVLRLRNNNRGYYMYGYETSANIGLTGIFADHDVTVGFRYHHDAIRRFQRDERFTQLTNGAISAQDPGTPGNAGNRKQQVEAYALWVQDAMQFGALTITPGLRVEHLNMFARDFADPANPARNGKSDLSMEGGGVGITYEMTDQLMVLGGFHRGFSPPSPRGRLGGLTEEISYASEGGIRYMNNERPFAMQAIGFYTHFQDLIVIDNIGGTGTGDDESVGAVYAGGLELTMEYDLGRDMGWSFQNPWWLVLTWTDARVLGGATSTDPESIFAGAFAGARVPYIPEWAITFGTGAHWELFGVDMTCIYVDKTFATASNSTNLVNPITSNPDARFGTTDSYFLIDMAGYVVLSGNWRLIGGVQNVGDRNYIISRHPHGARSGAPAFGYMGIEGRL